MNYNFKKCLDRSNHILIHKDFDKFYKDTFGKDVIIKRYDKNEIAQRDFGTDVVLILPSGITITVDEKLRTNSYAKNSFYCLELMSNEERKKKGWFYKGSPQYIIYGTEKPSSEKGQPTGLLYCFMFPMDLHFKKYILSNLHNLKKFRVGTNNLYHTSGVLVDWRTIQHVAGRNNVHSMDIERY